MFLCLCMWEVCMHMETQPWRQVSAVVTVHLISLDKGFHWTWGLVILLNWLTIEPHGLWCLCLLSTRITDTQLYSLCMWMLGIRIQVLELIWQVLPYWAISQDLYFRNVGKRRCPEVREKEQRGTNRLTISTGSRRSGFMRRLKWVLVSLRKMMWEMLCF